MRSIIGHVVDVSEILMCDRLFNNFVVGENFATLGIFFLKSIIVMFKNLIVFM